MKFKEIISGLEKLSRSGSEYRRTVCRLAVETMEMMEDKLYETSSLLKSQQARITELEAERQWIPVGERLPEDNERVLVWLTDIVGTYTKIDTDRRNYNRWVKWGRYVTHWMPLPEPPKEENGDGTAT